MWWWLRRHFQWCFRDTWDEFVIIWVLWTATVVCNRRVSLKRKELKSFICRFLPAVIISIASVFQHSGPSSSDAQSLTSSCLASSFFRLSLSYGMLFFHISLWSCHSDLLQWSVLRWWKRKKKCSFRHRVALGRLSVMPDQMWVCMALRIYRTHVIS